MSVPSERTDTSLPSFLSIKDHNFGMDLRITEGRTERVEYLEIKQGSEHGFSHPFLLCNTLPQECGVELIWGSKRISIPPVSLPSPVTGKTVWCEAFKELSWIGSISNVVRAPSLHNSKSVLQIR